MRVAAVQFAHMGDAEALNVEPREENGIIVADIPNILLQSGQKIAVFLVDVNENKVETTTHAVLPVIPRPRPTDYVYTETEVLSWQALEARVIAFMDEMNEAREAGDFNGDSAYEIAVKYGYEGTEEEWIAELYGNAAKSAAEAKEAEEKALRYAESAATSERNAAGSANAAAAHEESAKSAEKQAQQYAGWAENYETKTKSYHDGALTARNEALQYTQTAGSMARSASASADRAETFANEAESKTQQALEEAKASGVFNGPPGNDYVLTPADKKEIAEQAAQLVEVPEGGSGIEVTAKPGQLIRVKETDENGKPTAWEAVPWGYTEGGMVEILPECQPTYYADEGMFGIMDAPAVVPGKTYFVNWNGVEYECVASAGDGMDVITAEPFDIVTMNGAMVIVPYDGTTELTLSIHADGEVVHPLDTKYLPEGVPYVEKGGMVEILPETTVELDADGYGATGLFTIAAGEKCVVNWNGTEYECVAQDLSGMYGGGSVLIGNGSEIGMEGNGEPFYIGVAPAVGGTTIVAIDGTVSTNITLSIKGESAKVQKLDKRCLPDGVGDSPVVVVSIKSFDEAAGVVIMSHTAKEIYNALLSAKIVFLGFELYFAFNGEVFYTDDVLNKIGFAALLDPATVVYVDKNGMLIFPEE